MFFFWSGLSLFYSVSIETGTFLIEGGTYVTDCVLYMMYLVFCCDAPLSCRYGGGIW